MSEPTDSELVALARGLAVPGVQPTLATDTISDAVLRVARYLESE